MTENIFANGGEFCMRGDPEHKPVEWHWFKTSTDTFQVVYVDKGTIRSVSLSGAYLCSGGEVYNDLIPIPSPPQIVPWESPDDVPDRVWFRHKLNTSDMRCATGYTFAGTYLAGGFITWDGLHKHYEYHTDRRATDGWQPCGKVVTQ